ncbi:MAG TPA: 30S ribosomal protein S9 [Candidatus Thermoplasmatota archaeon]|nr:30S ribosomal protein S9 [Candidatus Thermoplasmatota archaeon]
MKIVSTSGKRKTAVARANVRKGEGRVRINNVPLEIVTPELCRQKMQEPLILVGEGEAGKVDIDVSVRGGGVMGQADAVRTAIARGLVEFLEDQELKKRLLALDRSLMVSDIRRKEPKHPMGRGARKKWQKSYR